MRLETPRGPSQPVNGISYAIAAGRTLAVVGESGAGKTLAHLAALGLVADLDAQVTGSVHLEGREVLGLSEDELRALRGSRVAIVFQDALAALHPLYTVGRQVSEAILAHREMPRRAARRLAVEALAEVGLPDPAARYRAYSHELSGGMRQRAMIAMAIVNDPAVLIADEPTSSLDVVAQAEVLALLHRLQAERGMAMVLITHDLAVVAEHADEIAVMHAGRVVEQADTPTLLSAPSHPETKRLLGLGPDAVAGRRRAAAPPSASRSPSGGPLLEVRDLVKDFRAGPRLPLRRSDPVRAVDGVSLELARGETLGLVGETGAGKTTTGRLIARLLEPTAGSVRFAGEEITGLRGRRLRAFRRQVQIVFQDPYSSLNPRRPVGAAIGAGLAVHGIEPSARPRRRRVEELLERVGLTAPHYDRFPHELSAGERQRVAVARALVVRPALLIADEPVSALDAPVQAQVLALLAELRDELELTMIFISHDLAVVGDVCDRVAVMHRGAIVEAAPTGDLFARPKHRHTRSLISAIPAVSSPAAPDASAPAGRRPDPRVQVAVGEVGEGAQGDDGEGAEQGDGHDRR